MNYALIEDGIVVNIIWLNPYNASDFPTAVAMNDRPVAIGDAYIDGHFYREGAEVLTEAERLALELAESNQALQIIMEGE